MAQGIKIVKAGAKVATNVPEDIVVDTREQGAMKIHAKVMFREDPAYLSYVEDTGQGMQNGFYVYYHNLGFPPAFMLYRLQYRSTTNTNDATIMPAFGPDIVGQTEAFVDSEKILIANLYADPHYYNLNNSRPHIVLYVFAENIDADV